jgi:tRNA threonylcarbamoyladenosine biosynthesis protein TsaE
MHEVKGPILSAHCFRSRSAAETHALGRALGAALVRQSEAGLVVALDGELGAGKTVFVKGLAEGLGLSSDQVSSPTFVLAQQYLGPASGAHRISLHHIDLYRIEHEAELDGFGFDELLDPPHVAAVEWSSRFPAALPADRLTVRIDREADAPPEARRMEAAASGPRSEAALLGWCTQAEAVP